jgi:hypothetical protein
MPYVMLPVPEELVQEVMQFVIRTVQRAAVEPWDEASITEVYNDVDEVSRSLLAFVARSAVEGVDISLDEAAQKIQMTGREAAGILNELSSLSRNNNRPNLMDSRAIRERLANGRVVEKRILLMEPEHAEIQSAGNPLRGIE